MKISTYHKRRGDSVCFYKGVMEESAFIKGAYDRVYITSMFTFHYDITVKTLNAYQEMSSPNKIFIGGIMASLMKDRLIVEVDEEVTILTGLLIDSEAIGFDDHTNIDVLPLDYSILDDTSFKYGAGDNYFAYVSRGCTNKCMFCAVPILEPEFCLTNHIVEQIATIISEFGEKQNLLLLDNNILSFSPSELKTVINDIKSLGFDKNTKFYPELPLIGYMRKLYLYEKDTPRHNNVLAELLDYLHEKQNTKKSKNYQAKYSQLIFSLSTQEDKFAFILQNYDAFHEILGYYHKPVGRRRAVDFNQGIDARQLTEEKMAILAQIPIEPFRLAFDAIRYKDIYIRAVNIAIKYGIKQFSNYILFNFEDTPDDLWKRLQINIELAKENNIKIFSFPMKYAPVDRTDRTFVGKYWNRYYLSNLSAILNVTKGIVADGESFFYKAFGKDIGEFYEILSMPREFVTYRSYFEATGQADEWKKCFYSLSPLDKNELINALCEKRESANKKVAKTLQFYKIKKNT